MTSLLVIALGAMTYLSRVIGLVAMPAGENRLTMILTRLPAGLFAGLAITSLIDGSGSLRSIPSLVAALFALTVAPTRSLPIIFVGGVAGYVVAMLIF